jgi:subtilisin family serine protease
MGRRSISLLNLGVVLSLAFSGTLSGILWPSPVATGTSSAPTAAAGHASPESSSLRVKQEQTHDRKQQKRQQNNTSKDGKAGPKQKDKKRDRSGSKAGRDRSVEERYIVVLEPDSGKPKSAASAVASESADVVITHVYDEVLDGFAAIIPDDQLDEVRNDPRVQSVVPDQEVRAFDLKLPTGINRVDADQNSTAKIDGRDERVDVDVAVLDTGIGPHPDLNVVGGISCIEGNTSFADDNGHGTHVAGTIGAFDDGVGVVGVAPGARLWSVKVLDSDKHGWWSDVICGLNWVAANSDKIDVVNMSLGWYGDDGPCAGTALHEAVCRVVDAGIPVVVAAGNDSQDAAGIVPAAYDEVITVSALADSDGRPGGNGPATTRGPDDSLASFSNFGADVDIAAPGVDILSTVPGGYARGYGTSVASPHVAGAAALFLANSPDATPAEVKANLLSTRKDIVLPKDPDGSNEGVLFVGKDKKRGGKKKR